MAQNYYEVLGLDANAESDEIIKAYRSLAKAYHPDTATHPNAKTLFEKISAAYSVLSDPEKRSAYDKELKESEKQEILPEKDEYSLMADYEYTCEKEEHFLIDGTKVAMTGARHLIIGEREYIVYDESLIDIGGKLSFKVEGPERYLVDGAEKLLRNADHFIQKGDEYVVIEGKPFLVRKMDVE
jgi:curved DNA-binding protein CbpA